MNQHEQQLTISQLLPSFIEGMKSLNADPIPEDKIVRKHQLYDSQKQIVISTPELLKQNNKLLINQIKKHSSGTKTLVKIQQFSHNSQQCSNLLFNHFSPKSTKTNSQMSIEDFPKCGYQIIQSLNQQEKIKNENVNFKIQDYQKYSEQPKYKSQNKKRRKSCFGTQKKQKDQKQLHNKIRTEKTNYIEDDIEDIEYDELGQGFNVKSTKDSREIRFSYNITLSQFTKITKCYIDQDQPTEIQVTLKKPSTTKLP